MFDQETTQFFHMLRSNTIGEGSSIGLRSLLESNIPANVKTFFRADVEWLRMQEKMREVKSSKFSFAIPEVRLLEEQIDLLLVNNFTFTRKDFDASADKCIHFLLNYLCRPQWTLNSFFFDQTIRITAEEMLAKLRYCADYAYYRAVLEKYAESRQRTDVGSEEMKRLLKTIDDEICLPASPKELAVITRPVFDFVGAIRATMDPPLPARVPVRAMIYFFEDKKMTKYAEAFSALRERDSALELSQFTLEMVLEAVADNAPVPDPSMLMAAAAEHEASDASILSRFAFETKPEHAAVSSEAPLESALVSVAIPEEPVETPEPSAASIDTLPSDTEPELSYTGSAEKPADEDEVQRMMYQRQAGIVEHHEEEAPVVAAAPEETEPEEAETPEEAHGGPIVVSPPYFSDGDKQTIISTLFQGDEALFDEAISTAANTLTWDEAIISLDRFFAEHGIDPFSKEAMMFANILESWHRMLSGNEP